MRRALAVTALLVAAPAVAAQRDGGHYVWVPDGATVVLLPSASATQVAFPVARMIAQREATMHRLFADMESRMATMPDPKQMVRSVMQGMPRIGPGSAGVVVTSIRTGHGTCRQIITYGYPGNGGQPTARVSSTGNACQAVGTKRPVAVTRPQPPSPPPVPAPMAPRHGRVWTAGYPPHPLTTGVSPRM
jgi:hypothetical protein